MVTANDFDGFAEELVVFLRNQDVLTIAQRGVTTTSDSFDGDTSTVAFTLTNDPVHNVRSITVGGSAQTFGTDYTVAYNATSSVVTFTSAPALGTDNIVVNYDYESTDGSEKIWNKYPKRVLSLDKFPRISLDYTNITTQVIGVGGQVTRSIGFIDISIDSTAPRALAETVRSKILDNPQNFFNALFITPISIKPQSLKENTGQDILRKTVECRVVFVEEV